MRVLFDQGTPVPLRQHLTSHQVETAFELGWSRLSNGDLLAAAEGRFDVLITTDKNVRQQQSLARRKLAVLILPTTSWPRLENQVDKIASSLASINPGQFLELQL